MSKKKFWIIATLFSLAVIFAVNVPVSASGGDGVTCCEMKKSTCKVFGFDPRANEYSLNKPGPCPDSLVDPDWGQEDSK